MSDHLTPEQLTAIDQIINGDYAQGYIAGCLAKHKQVEELSRRIAALEDGLADVSGYRLRYQARQNRMVVYFAWANGRTRKYEMH
jgi:hypothetical protein